MANELMTDDEFCNAIEQLGESGDHDLSELIKAMNESRIISWEEAERILQDTCEGPIKSSLPEQTRPSEPENDTDVEKCIRRLNENDPTLKEVNLNNMKRTPVPHIRRLLEALAYNEYCERISLANMGLYDNDIAVLPSVLEINQSLKKLNLETNYLSGDFFSRLFKAACVNMTLEEVKAVNQGVSFATTAEKEIIEAIVSNKGLIKVSVNLRLPEGRHKIEHATLRNGEYKRILRREAALKAKQEAEELAKNPVPKLAKELPKKAPEPQKTAAPLTKPRGSQVTNPTIASSAKEKPGTERRPSVQMPPLVRRPSNADQSSTPVIPMIKAVDKAPSLQKPKKMVLKNQENGIENKPAKDENGEIKSPLSPTKPPKKPSEISEENKAPKAKLLEKNGITTAPKPKAKTAEEKPMPVKPRKSIEAATPESELSADSGTATPVKKSSLASQPSTTIKETLKKLAENEKNAAAAAKAALTTPKKQTASTASETPKKVVSKSATDAPKATVTENGEAKPAGEVVKKKKIVKRVVKKKKPVDGDSTTTSTTSTAKPTTETTKPTTPTTPTTKATTKATTPTTPTTPTTKATTPTTPTTPSTKATTPTTPTTPTSKPTAPPTAPKPASRGLSTKTTPTVSSKS